MAGRLTPLEIWIEYEAHTWACSECDESDPHHCGYYHCQSYKKVACQWDETAKIESLDFINPFDNSGYEVLNLYVNSPECWQRRNSKRSKD